MKCLFRDLLNRKAGFENLFIQFLLKFVTIFLKFVIFGKIASLFFISCYYIVLLFVLEVLDKFKHQEHLGSATSFQSLTEKTS